MRLISALLAAAVVLSCSPAFAYAPNADNPNGLPCDGGPDYRGRMIGPWSPARFDGDPIGIRYSPRWDIFYYAQCMDPGVPGVLPAVLAKVIADGKISKPGCQGGKAIKYDQYGALKLCSDEADSYVTIRGSGSNAVWVVGYYGNGAPPSPPPGNGPGPGTPLPTPTPSPTPTPAPTPAPPSGPKPGDPFVAGAPTTSEDYFVGDDDASHCPAPDPSHPYRSLMFGFDLSRIETAAETPKYAFAKLAQDLPPTDSCMRVIAKALGPSMGCLDPQDNYMLDVTRDGYIGYRTWSPGYAHWSWFGYNDAHPDPGDAGPEGKSPNCGTYHGPIVYQR